MVTGRTMSWPWMSSACLLTFTRGKESAGDEKILQTKTTQGLQEYCAAKKQRTHTEGALWKILLHNGIEDSYERKIFWTNSPPICLDHLIGPTALWLASNPTCKKRTWGKKIEVGALDT